MSRWEKRVSEQTVAREENHVAQLATYTIIIALMLEEPTQSFFREIAFDRRRVSSLASDAKCLKVEIGAEYLNFRREIATGRLLEQKDADGVGLLTGGAARKGFARASEFAQSDRHCHRQRGGKEAARDGQATRPTVGKLAHGKHEVCDLSGDRTAGHRGILCLFVDVGKKPNRIGPKSYCPSNIFLTRRQQLARRPTLARPQEAGGTEPYLGIEVDGVQAFSEQVEL